jgi:urease accessory protein
MMIDPATPALSTPPAMQRVRGRAHVRFARHGDVTRLADLGQSGSAKIRLPKTHDAPPVAVFLNTAGGLTGGDRLEFDAAADEAAHAILTTQAAERIYRSADGPAEVASVLRAGGDAVLEWLPQETILFDSASLVRSLSVDLAPGARLLAVESVVLGREAMGEDVRALGFRDRWRIRRNGRLVFADEARIDGDATDILSGSATAAGGRAFATLVDCREGAAGLLDTARTRLDILRGERLRAGVSALPDLLVFRFLADTGQDLRDGLVAFLEGWRGAPLPRTWYC